MATDNNQLYETFIQKNGSRKGQSYKMKRGKSGLLERVYASGQTADAEQRKLGFGGRMPTPKAGPPPGYNVGSPAPSGTLPKPKRGLGGRSRLGS